MSPQDAPLLFGRYRLLERIARGGMAEVFRAKSHGIEGFEKQVVLKRILPELARNQQFVDLFLHEARLSVSLSHANIVQVFDLGREDDTYFIAMEHVHGLDLAQVLTRCRARNTPVPVEVAGYIGGEVARALDYAHRRKDAHGRMLGLVHRDVSPHNVLVSYEGEVKVTDFGIAKARTMVESMGLVRGKTQYMAPEQARGEDVDARADLYALGVTLYEALAGRNPFTAPPGETGKVRAGGGPTPDEEVLDRVLYGRFEPLRNVRPEVPDALEEIVHKAMSLDPAARYSTAADFYEDLSALLFTLGQRVGPHDLSEWMHGLRNEGDIDEVSLDDVEDVDEGGEQPEVIPARDELREVTLLCAQGVRMPEGAIDAWVTQVLRRGGRVLDLEGDQLVACFGLDAPDGRDVASATEAGWWIQHGTAPSALHGVGVVAATLRVGHDGAVIREARFESAVMSAQELAMSAQHALWVSAEAPPAERFETSSAMEDAVAVTAVHEPARRKVAGRGALFRQFGEVLAKAANEGIQVITVEGALGMGRTRFVDEVRYRLKRMKHPVTWLSATCPARGRDMPWSGLQAMLREMLDIRDDDRDAVVREKARRVRERGLTPEEMLAVGMVLGVVRGSRESIVGASKSLRGAMGRLLNAYTAEQVTVLAWDQAEHLDELSTSLLEGLIERHARSPLAVAFTVTPGAWLPWRERPGACVMTLPPLTGEEMRQFVGIHLGTAAPVPDTLEAVLLQRSMGAPLAAEAALRAMVDAGAVAIAPDQVGYEPSLEHDEPSRALRCFYVGRSLELDPTARHALLAAATIEEPFTADTLRAAGARGALDAALDTLRGLGWIVEEDGGMRFATSLARQALAATAAESSTAGRA